jgi:cytochrome P450
MGLMLFLAGLDTVTSAMSHVVHFLAASAPHRRELLEDPALIPEAVEELLRRFGIASIGRITAQDCEFHGVQFRKGDMVLYSTPMLSLDGTRFADPLRVHFRRDNRRQHLAFGTGPHLCAGHLLARIELRVMIEELLPRLPNLRLQPGARLAYESGGTLALKSLPIAWDAAVT